MMEEVNKSMMNTTTTDDDHSTTYWQVVASAQIIVGIAALIGNGVVAVTIITTPDLRKDKNNKFIANMACVNMAYAAFVFFPIAAWNLQDEWQHGVGACRFLLWAETVFINISNASLALISVSKYLYVRFPLEYERLLPTHTKRWRWIAPLMLTWVVPMAYTLPMWMRSPVKGDCEIIFSDPCLIVISVCTFVIPFTVIVVFSLLVVKLCREMQSRDHTIAISLQPNHRERRSWKALRSFLMVVCAFLFLSGPIALCAIYDRTCRAITRVHLINNNTSTQQSVENDIFSIYEHNTSSTEALAGHHNIPMIGSAHVSLADKYCIPNIWLFEYLPYGLYLSAAINPLIYFFFERRFRVALVKRSTCARYRERRQRMSIASGTTLTNSHIF